MPASIDRNDSISPSYDAVIIGAGVIGCAIAYNLCQKGYRTLNIDALPAAGYGSTSSSAAVVRTYYSTLDGSAMAIEGYHCWRNWTSYLDNQETDELARFIETGSLVMKTQANGFLKKVLKSAEQLDIPHEHWSPDQIREAMPGYHLDCYAPAKKMDNDEFGLPSGGELTGGAYFPNGGYVDDPQLAARNLKTAAENLGGKFLFKTKVTNILVENKKIIGVELDDGQTITAPIVVNAGGPHSGKVNELLQGNPGMNIRTRPLRQEVVQISPPEALGYSKEGLIVSDNDIACYIKPGSGGQLMIGSENPPCDASEEVDPDNFSRDLSDRALTYAYRYSQRLPDLGVSQHPIGVADLYDATDDWLPIYDCSDISGYYLAIGTSGNQFKNAPVAGRLMAELIEFCENGGKQDEEPLQFQLKHVDHAINTATFSRKRSINQDSSFSVIG